MKGHPSSPFPWSAEPRAVALYQLDLASSLRPHDHNDPGGSLRAENTAAKGVDSGMFPFLVVYSPCMQNLDMVIRSCGVYA